MPSSTPTPYAVICYKDGKIYLSKEEYDYQMNRPDNLWICPRCGECAVWDDANYEKFLDELDSKNV